MPKDPSENPKGTIHQLMREATTRDGAATSGPAIVTIHGNANIVAGGNVTIYNIPPQSPHPKAFGQSPRPKRPLGQ